MAYEARDGCNFTCSPRPGSLKNPHFLSPCDRISLCSLWWPETHYTDEIDIMFLDICLPLPLEYWDTTMTNLHTLLHDLYRRHKKCLFLEYTAFTLCTLILRFLFFIFSRSIFLKIRNHYIAKTSNDLERPILPPPSPKYTDYRSTAPCLDPKITFWLQKRSNVWVQNLHE